MIQDIKEPGNPADTVISLTIAGNDLVRITNFISLITHGVDYILEQKDTLRELNCINLQIIEQLSTQRCNHKRY